MSDLPCRSTRRQSRTEAAVSDGMMAFQHDFVGRGPDRIRTYITCDLVVVRSSGVFMPAEKHLVESVEGRETVRELRRRIVEAGRGELEGIVHERTGVRVVSVHSDLSAETGDWMLVFALERNAEGDGSDR